MTALAPPSATAGTSPAPQRQGLRPWARSALVVAYEIVRRYEVAAEQRRVAAQLRALATAPTPAGSSSGGTS